MPEEICAGPSQALLDVVVRKRLLTPIQELPKRGTPMAVRGFLHGAEFGKRPLNLRKIKERIVSESVRPRGASRMTLRPHRET